MGAHVMQQRQPVAHQRRLLGQLDGALRTNSSACTTGRPIAARPVSRTPTCCRWAKSQGGNTNAAGRTTYFTTNEQYTLMSLWAIARSPLIHGGDMTQMDAFTLSLLTNDEVIAVNQIQPAQPPAFPRRRPHRLGRRRHRLRRQIPGLVQHGGGGDHGAGPAFPARLQRPGANPLALGKIRPRDRQRHVLPAIPSHGAAIYKLSGPGLPTPWLAGIEAGNGQATLDGKPCRPPLSTASNAPPRKAARSPSWPTTCPAPRPPSPTPASPPAPPTIT